jgi:hypothetical protein
MQPIKGMIGMSLLQELLEGEARTIRRRSSCRENESGRAPAADKSRKKENYQEVGKEIIEDMLFYIK